MRHYPSWLLAVIAATQLSFAPFTPGVTIGFGAIGIPKNFNPSHNDELFRLTEKKVEQKIADNLKWYGDLFNRCHDGEVTVEERDWQTCELVKKAAAAFEISEDVFMGLIAVESNYVHRGRHRITTSEKGCIGFGQLCIPTPRPGDEMYQVFERVGAILGKSVEEINKRDPWDNLLISAGYLDHLRSKLGADLILAVGAYLQGEYEYNKRLKNGDEDFFSMKTSFVKQNGTYTDPKTGKKKCCVVYPYTTDVLAYAEYYARQQGMAPYRGTYLASR